jgi:hypothetical protein
MITVDPHILLNLGKSCPAVPETYKQGKRIESFTVIRRRNQETERTATEWEM